MFMNVKGVGIIQNEIVFSLQWLVGGHLIINTQVIKANQLIICNHYLLNDHINLEVPKDLGSLSK